MSTSARWKLSFFKFRVDIVIFKYKSLRCKPQLGDNNTDKMIFCYSVIANLALVEKSWKAETIIFAFFLPEITTINKLGARTRITFAAVIMTS